MSAEDYAAKGDEDKIEVTHNGEKTFIEKKYLTPIGKEISPELISKEIPNEESSGTENVSIEKVALDIENLSKNTKDDEEKKLLADITDSIKKLLKKGDSTNEENRLFPVEENKTSHKEKELSPAAAKLVDDYKKEIERLKSILSTANDDRKKEIESKITEIRGKIKDLRK